MLMPFLAGHGANETNYKAPTSTVTKHGDTIYVTGRRLSNRKPERFLAAQSNGKPSSSWSS